MVGTDLVFGRSLIVVIFAGLGIGSLYVAVLAAGVVGDSVFVASLILVGTYLFGIVRLTKLFITAEFRPGLGFLWCFICFHWALPGFVQLNAGFYWPLYLASSLDRIYASLMMLVFAVGVEISYYWCGSQTKSSAFESAPGPWVSCVVSVVAAGSAVFAVAKFGLDLLVKTRYDADVLTTLDLEDGKEIFGILIVLRSVCVVSLLICLSSFRNRIMLGLGVSAESGFLVVAVLLSIICFGIVNFPLNLPRFFLLGYFFAIICIVFFPLRLFFTRMFLAFYPLLAYSLSPFVNYLTRGHAKGEGMASSLGGMLLHGDFGDFQMAAEAIALTAKDGFHSGMIWLSSIFFFVPRAIWLEKSLPPPSYLAQANGFWFENMSTSPFVEAYMDWGYLGVVLCSAAVGAILCRVDRMFKRGDVATFSTIFAALALGFLPILFRGSLIGVLPVVAMALCMVIVAWKLEGMWGTMFRRSSGVPNSNTFVPSNLDTVSSVKVRRDL